MNNSMFVEATAADALTIIGLRRRIWDTTYRGIYPDSMIDDFDWAWHKEKELSRIHLPAYSVYLIQKDGRDIGYLTRQGIGRIAFDFIKEYCKEQCAESFICQCVPDNLDARAFYERMGGKVIGEDLANEERWKNSITYRFSLTEEFPAGLTTLN